MKIYHKRNFALGLFLAGMGAVILLWSLPEVLLLEKSVLLLALLCLLTGGWLIARSLSKGLSREDRVEELDERNQFVKLRSGSRAFQITQYACMGLMAVSLGIGRSGGAELFLHMGYGFGAAFFISVCAELAAGMYYEKRG